MVLRGAHTAARHAVPMFPSAQNPSPFKRSHPRGNTGPEVQVCRLYVTHAWIEVNPVATDAVQPNVVLLLPATPAAD
jgi:hypothetical protein